MEERKALKKLQAGDEQALCWFIDRYTAYVSTIVHSVIGAAMGKADVEEVTADVFLALWQNREKVQQRKCRAYLSALARNTALNRLRQRRQELPLEDDRITFSVSPPGAGVHPERAGRAGAAKRAGTPLAGQRDFSPPLLLLPAGEGDRRRPEHEGIHSENQAVPGP